MVGPIIMFCDKVGPKVLGRPRASDKLAILTIHYTKCFQLIGKGIYWANFFPFIFNKMLKLLDIILNTITLIYIIYFLQKFK